MRCVGIDAATALGPDEIARATGEFGHIHVIGGTNTDYFFARFHGGGVEEPVAPLVSLLPPTDLSTTTLSFNAKVDSRGQNTTVEVDYGPTTSYGTTVALIDVPAGLIPVTRSLPLTGRRVVDMVISELGVFAIDKTGDGGVTLIELADGVTVDEVKAKTKARLSISADLKATA